MPDELSFAEERWVRIMADNCADEISVDESPVSRNRRWQELYDFESPLLPAPERPFDDEAFATEGLAIARAVKAALPDWTVIALHDAVVAGRRHPAQRFRT